MGEYTALQKEVCSQAIEKGLLRPYDIIDYTYSNARLKEMQQGNIEVKNSSNNDISCTLTTKLSNFGIAVPENKDSSSLRMRTYTPLESWRLMGFDDEDFEKASPRLKKADLYKQAGNSIVVNVLMAIFKELFVQKKTRSEWLDELLS